VVSSNHSCEWRLSFFKDNRLDRTKTAPVQYAVMSLDEAVTTTSCTANQHWIFHSFPIVVTLWMAQNSLQWLILAVSVWHSGMNNIEQLSNHKSLQNAEQNNPVCHTSQQNFLHKQLRSMWYQNCENVSEQTRHCPVVLSHSVECPWQKHDSQVPK